MKKISYLWIVVLCPLSFVGCGAIMEAIRSDQIQEGVKDTVTQAMSGNVIGAIIAGATTLIVGGAIVYSKLKNKKGD